jgi:outer membrane lipoprotein-sorting protein
MFFRLLLTLYLAASLLPPCANARGLDEVLASMDRAAASFRDMSATLKRIDHTAVINDTSEEIGNVRMKRPSRKVHVLIEFTEPDPRTLSFQGQKAEIYYPKIKTVQVYDLGKYRQLVDQFLLLGFGSSGKELRKSYSLRVVGEDKVSGELTTRLELLPKSKSARKHLDKVELWISTSGYPLQQKFYQPSGDYVLITYSDLKINPDFPEDALKLKLPGDVKREYPQK